MASEFEIECQCLYERKKGIVQLSPTHLVWTPDSAADGNELQLSLTSICQHQVTKEGSAKKAMIRLTCSDREVPVKLDFAKNWTDRDAVRNTLIRLQGGGGLQASQGQAASAPSTNGKRKQMESDAKSISPEEVRKRKRMLEYSDVAKLYMSLVRETNALTDEEFWGAIKYKFKPNGERRPNVAIEQGDTEVDTKGAQKGIPSAAFTAPSDGAQVKDIEPKTWENGIPNPSQRHRIFLLLPVAARAYSSLVPEKKSEKDFWKVVRESSMAKKLSKNARFLQDQATANKADQLFANFQASERTTANREAKEREKRLHPSLDFRRFDDHRAPHVLEGHAMYGDAPRQVSRPGVRDLPSSQHLNIMRDVNLHARLIVDDTFMSKNNTNSVAPGWEKDPSEKGALLDDLMQHEQPQFAALSAEAIQKATPVFQADANGNAGSEAILPSAVSDFTGMLQDWRVDLSLTLRTEKGNGMILRSLLEKMRP